MNVFKIALKKIPIIITITRLQNALNVILVV